MNLDSICIILVRPKFPENIGSVARAMKNMGLSRLIVVNGSSPLHANAYMTTFRTSFIEIMVTTSFNRNSETV